MKRILGRSTLSFIFRLSTFIGVWALLVAPALAQVNGSGPSPSSDFHTVLNLPGDEAITGASYGSIGGFGPAFDFQLNVSDGGTVGQHFDADINSEVNISGGTVDHSFDANSGSEVNISGGTVGSNFDANSNLSLIHI